MVGEDGIEELVSVVIGIFKMLVGLESGIQRVEYDPSICTGVRFYPM